MDVAAAGFAASQIASAQRGQQAALSGIRAQQKQDLNVSNLLQQAVSAAQQVAGTSPVAPQAVSSAPSLDSASTGQAPTGSNGQPPARGSLVNIIA